MANWHKLARWDKPFAAPRASSAAASNAQTSYDRIPVQYSTETIKGTHWTHPSAHHAPHRRWAARERERVQQHIARAEMLARGRDLNALSPLQKLVRSLLLQCLGEYRDAGQFPHNRDFAKRTPYFIDARGVRCAMAHLLEVGGEHELVQRIARERNNATIAQLADEPRLLAWLAAAGLTVQEAAAIQPFYCAEPSDCFCSAGLFAPLNFSSVPRASLPRISSVVRGEVVAADPLRQTVVVREIYGNCGALRLGDTVITQPSFDAVSFRAHGIGQQVLAGISLDSEGHIRSQLYAVGVNPDDTVSCPSITRITLTPTTQQVTAATLAGALQCQSVLEALDPRWAGRYGPFCEAGAMPTDASADPRDGWVVGDVTDPARCMVDPRPDVMLADTNAGIDGAVQTDAASDSWRAGDVPNRSLWDDGPPMDVVLTDVASMQMPPTTDCTCSTVPFTSPPISSFAVLTAVLSALSMRARMRARVRSINKASHRVISEPLSSHTHSSFAVSSTSGPLAVVSAMSRCLGCREERTAQKNLNVQCLISCVDVHLACDQEPLRQR